jgi:hypothetical protein
MSGKIGFNQPLIYVHHFPLFHPKFFFAFFNSVAEKRLFLGGKNIGSICLPPPSNAYACS